MARKPTNWAGISDLKRMVQPKSGVTQYRELRFLDALDRGHLFRLPAAAEGFVELNQGQMLVADRVVHADLRV